MIELLVAMVIAAVVLVTVPPLFFKSLPGAQARGATHQLLTALRSTRNLAISQNRDAALLIDLENRRYQLPSAAQGVQLDKDLTLAMTSAESERIDEYRSAIRFYADGSSTGGRIEINSARHQYTLDVDWLTGRITQHE